MAEHDYNVYHARFGRRSMVFPDSGVQQRDLEALTFCRTLVTGPEDECNSGCEMIMEARRQGLVLKDEHDARVRANIPRYAAHGDLPPRVTPGNAWLFKSMVLLAEDRSKRTSFVLVRKVLDGCLPEELIEMIREFYLEDKVEQMAKLKEEYDGHWEVDRNGR